MGSSSSSSSFSGSSLSSTHCYRIKSPAIQKRPQSTQYCSSRKSIRRFQNQIKQKSIISTKGTRGKGTRGRGGGRGGARPGSSSSGHMPNVEAREAPASSVTETGSHDSVAGDDAFSQAMLRILERVAPNVVEYWVEATRRIMGDLDCTPEHKLKGAVSLLRDKAYQWWLKVKEGTQPDQLTWEFFKTIFQGKYIGASYVDAWKREFLNLTQGDRSVAEYEAEFLRLSRYAHGMMATEYKHCVYFEDSLRDSLRDRGRNKRDLEPSSSFLRPKKKARVDGLVRVGAHVAATGSQPCADYGKRHQGECWKRIKACLRCKLLEHRIRDYPWRLEKMQATGLGNRAPGRGPGHTEARQVALVYAVPHREDRDAPDVITGIFFIRNVSYTILIDVGSTHSYIACTVSETLGIMVESTTSKVTMLSLLGQLVRVNKLFRDIPLEVQGVIFLADLMELPFGEFNLILGMDLLVKHRANLDCTTK
ncbi:uncharacterized protein LOC128283908 [Gossypium arboreum]|uniref:uncharacterized protein LOC128283908 n=1 Tax=Gossypium arboreum TaxID=29729 RepID=UPI0022F147CE|nr:uncharacterized protein LOC128283908 [Gossypium arboreum]